MLREHLLAEAVEQKTALAVLRTAADGLHKAAEQAGRQRRLEQHRAFDGIDLATTEAAQGTLCGITADRAGAGQFVRVAHRAVPVIALHGIALAGDRGHAQGMARTGIAPPEAMRVGTEEMALLRRYRSPFAVADLRITGKSGVFTSQCQLRGRIGIDIPGVKQIQLAHVGFHVLLVGQAGSRVLRRVARHIVGRLHRLLDRLARKVGGAGIATLLADVDRHAERLVAVALDVFQLATAHRHRQATALGGFGADIGGTQLFRMGDGEINQFLEVGSAVGKAAQGLIGRNRKTGRFGFGFHGEVSYVLLPCLPDNHPCHANPNAAITSAANSLPKAARWTWSSSARPRAIPIPARPI